MCVCHVADARLQRDVLTCDMEAYDVVVLIPIQSCLKHAIRPMMTLSCHTLHVCFIAFTFLPFKEYLIRLLQIAEGSQVRRGKDRRVIDYDSVTTERVAVNAFSDKRSTSPLHAVSHLFIYPSQGIPKVRKRDNTKEMLRSIINNETRTGESTSTLLSPALSDLQ